MSRPPQIRISEPKTNIKTTRPQSEVAKLFERGLALHQQGRLEEAKAIYTQVLAKDSRHFDALHLSGVLASQSKNPELAVTLIDKALKIDPHHASAYSNRGIALLELKRLNEALASFDRAIAIKPDYAEAYSNRGNILRELKRLNEAVVSYDKAILIKSDYAEAYSNRGIALWELKRLQEALASFERAIAIKPDYAEAYSFQGVTLWELKRLEEAVASYDRAIAIRPDSAGAYSNRGVALQELGRLVEAVASCDKAIDIKPDYAEAHCNRGLILQELKRLEDAIVSFDKAIAIKPDYAKAYHDRGVAQWELMRPNEAVGSFDKAIAINPDDASAYWNKSLMLLTVGEFRQGWELYEWRWKNEKTGLKSRNFPQALWLGAEDISGKTLLLHAEQGLGDTIQFCRYARRVKERGARVILEVPKALLGLLDGLAGVDALIESGKGLAVFDYHCPLLSLPLAFKTDLTNIPSPAAYLSVVSNKRKLWSQRLGEKTKPRVGLVWSGSATHKNDANRSLSLQQLILNLPECCEYVSLQKEVRDADKDVLAGSGIRHYGDELKDFSDTAALCDLMDLVVSVDTSVAHLSGAIGKATWVLLPYVPDWRWLLDRDDSPWYESMKLYRQANDREWPAVLERVKRDLEAWERKTRGEHNAQPRPPQIFVSKSQISRKPATSV